MHEAPGPQGPSQPPDEVQAAAPPTDTAAIAEVVRGVLATLHGAPGADTRSLLAQVEELGRTIADAKAELAELRVQDITGSHIPKVTDELDAIVAHTASATHAILEACETLDRVAAGRLALDTSAAAALQSATTRIYEACSFQDVTGQRITKVVATLKAIEAKVAQILATFSARHGVPDTAAPRPHAVAVELVNGPQLPGQAMGQSDIDKLLASLD